MLTVGLTGGIGSGKTTVANHFKKLGIDVIDTDQIAHEITTANSEYTKKIIAHFGEQLLKANGKLDRKQLAKIVFDQPNERKWLEQTLHPKILAITTERIQQAKSPYCVVVIPLLIEKQLTALFDYILVIDLTEDTQIERATTRDNLSKVEVAKIMANQCTRQQRLALSDQVLDNNGAVENLLAQVEKLHAFYNKQAAG